MQAFGIGIPLGIALLTRWLATGRDQSSWRIAGNVVLVSIGTWPVMFITSIPSVVLNLVGMPIETARAVGVWLILNAAGVVTAWALADAYRARISGEVNLPKGIQTDRFALVSVLLYLVVAAIIWSEAMPAYLDARDGLTPGGDPIGWLPYSAVSAVLSMAIVTAAYLGRAPSRTTVKEEAPIDRVVAPA
jgi:hypothetical protein